MLKKLRMWFWTKKRTIDEMIKIDRILDVKLKHILDKLESLDQDKAYVCVIEGATSEEIEAAHDAFNRARGRMNWTSPQVLFLNKEIRVMTKDEIDTVIEQVRKQKRSVTKQ